MEKETTNLKPISALKTTVIIGSITICKAGKNGRNRKIYCKGDCFKDAEYYEFITEKSFLLIRKHFFEAPRKAIKMPKGRCFDMVSDLPIGKFSIDTEESTEDELVVYYK